MIGQAVFVVGGREGGGGRKDKWAQEGKRKDHFVSSASSSGSCGWGSAVRLFFPPYSPPSAERIKQHLYFPLLLLLLLIPHTLYFWPVVASWWWW